MLYLLLLFCFQHLEKYRNALFLGRCSRNFGFALHLLIARREFSTTDVTNMSRKCMILMCATDCRGHQRMIRSVSLVSIKIENTTIKWLTRL
jgi:hypothetical protein